MSSSTSRIWTLQQAAFSLFLLIVFAGVSNAQAPTTWYVQVDDPITGGLGTAGDFEKIQDAITNSTPGGTILVLESRISVDWSIANPNEVPMLPYVAITSYVEDIVYPSFDITIKAAPIYAGVGKVIEIKGTGSESVVRFETKANTRSSVLEGFTIWNGGGSDFPKGFADHVGGGIYCLDASPTIRNCIIRNNTAIAGGGVYAYFDPYGAALPADGPLLEGCRLENNTATGIGNDLSNVGGGLAANHCSPEISNCVFEFNRADSVGGGAMFYNAYDEAAPTLTPIVDKCSFLDNYAGLDGGGLGAILKANVQISESHFVHNEANQMGGGLYWDICAVDLSRSFVNGNHTNTFGGGGIAVEGEGFGFINSRIEHCTITRNRAGNATQAFPGGGLFVREGTHDLPNAGLIVENCLIANNKAGSGGGVAVLESAASLINCTISRNSSFSTAVAGGVYFWAFSNHKSWIELKDSILSNNLPGPGATVTNLWDSDFYNGTSIVGHTAPVITYCMIPSAGLWGALDPSNIVAFPYFATGPTSTYFPNGQFYLSHSAQQGITSQGYDNGSGPMHSGLAVFEMTCRTALFQNDVGTVDIGFHYPETELIPMP